MAATFATSSGSAWVLLIAWSLSRADAVDYFRWGSCGFPLIPDSLEMDAGIWFDNTDPTELSFSDCVLKAIKRDAFKNTPNLVDIRFDDSEITEVDVAAFKSVPKLKNLTLSGNWLREIPIFKPYGPGDKFVKLVLSRNQIIGIYNPYTFYACVNLEELDLSSNFIDYIHPDVFKHTYSLKRLYLHNNRIASVTMTMLPQKLSELWLNHNRIKHLPANFTSAFITAAKSRLFFGNNPWHCACLLELLADVKRAGVTYHGVYKNATHPQYGGARPACLPLGWHKCDVYRDSSF